MITPVPAVPLSTTLDTTNAPAALGWLRALREPQCALHWPLPEWERVVRLSRGLRLLPRLATSLRTAALLEQVPPQPRRHLEAALAQSTYRSAGLRWAAERVADVLGDAPYPCVLLKGAAYMAQDLALGQGRLPSDLDMLVPPEHLADAQRRLKADDWAEVVMNEHDTRYYDEWSHEIRPLHHPAVEVELDLHHAISPPISRQPVPTAQLLTQLQPSLWRGWQVLSPVDQLLHSALHLFHDADVSERLRDLVDQDALIRSQLGTADFWQRLFARAAELKLEQSLALCAWFTRRWLGTPWPAAQADALEQRALGGPTGAWIPWALGTLLMPLEPDQAPGWRHAAAAGAQALRYHLRRMPLRLLVPHAANKLRRPRTAT